MAPLVLYEVVSREDIHEWDERDDRGNPPSELGNEAEVAAAQQVDPDQDHGNRMEDAKNELNEFLHGGSRSRGGLVRLLAKLVATIVLAASPLSLAVATASTGGKAPSGLAYSTASGHVVQHQPARGSCHEISVGLYSQPDPRCTPGTVNPAVTQATIGLTICRSGWTATVRPPVSITEPEKFASMAAYGLRGSASAYEYDHLVPLELGGAVNDSRNLWPEPDYATRVGFYRNPKDWLENTLKRMVCRGAMTLAQAQRLIASNWTAVYHQLHVA
jgi:hypothetical protein